MLPRACLAVQAASRPLPAQPSSPSCSAHAEPSSQLHTADPAAELYPPSPPSNATAPLQACSPTEVPSGSPDTSKPQHQAATGQGPAPEQPQTVLGGVQDKAARSSTPSSVGSKQKCQGRLQPQAGQSLLSQSSQPDRSPSTGASAGSSSRGTTHAQDGRADVVAAAADQSAGLLQPQPSQAPASLPSSNPPFTIFGRCSQAAAPGQLPFRRDSSADADFAQHLHKVVHRHHHQPQQQQQQVKGAEPARQLGCRTAAAAEAGALHQRAQLQQPRASLAGEGEPCGMAGSRGTLSTALCGAAAALQLWQLQAAHSRQHSSARVPMEAGVLMGTYTGSSTCTVS